MFVHGRYDRRFVGAGLHSWGCHSWPGLLLCAACFQGESLGSFFILFRVVNVGASFAAEGTGGSWGICCASCSWTGGLFACSSRPCGGSALSLTPWSAAICVTPLVGSLDCSICTGCCLSGASRAEGFAAHLASAWAASIFMRSCRIKSCCCSATVGGS